MTQNNHSYLIIAAILLLVLILIPGTGALSISYSSTTSTSGPYSSSIGSSSSSLGSSVDIRTSSAVSGPSLETPSGGSEESAGDESGSFIVDDPPSVDPDFGDLIIESSPPGARVTLNTYPQPNQTPMLITMLNPGTYALVIRIDGYDPDVRDVEVVRGKGKKIIADFDGKFAADAVKNTTAGSQKSQPAGVWS